MNAVDESQSTGERLLTGYFDRFSVEHLHRYELVLPVVGGCDVLDIASGEGYGANLLAQAAKNVVGVDIDAGIVAHAERKYPRPNLRFLPGSADAIPLETASIDVAVSFETLEHHDRHDEMFDEIKRVLRPSGILVISTPDKLHFSDLTGHRNAYHVKELYFPEFAKLARRYFRNTCFYYQKTVVASVIVPQFMSSTMQLLRGDHERVEEHGCFPDATYNVCAASDGPLPELRTSLFEGTALLERMEHRIWDQEAELQRLARQNAALGRRLADLNGSLSYRLGAALLWPLKKIIRGKA